MKNLNNPSILTNQQYEVENTQLQNIAKSNLWAMLVVGVCVIALFGMNYYKGSNNENKED